MCLPLEMPWMVSASAAMMWDLPAPVAASMQHGAVFLLIQRMISSWASFWYGRRVMVISVVGAVIIATFNTKTQQFFSCIP